MMKKFRATTADQAQVITKLELNWAKAQALQTIKIRLPTLFLSLHARSPRDS